MADAQIAIKLTLQNEGGYVNNPADPGGPTKYGITQADMPGHDIAAITPGDAAYYYAANYWKPFYSQIVSQDIANKLFDLGVLFGVGTAVKTLQMVLGVLADGAFGHATLFATNALDATILLTEFKQRMVAHAEGIVAARPASGIFLVGWLRRINS